MIIITNYCQAKRIHIKEVQHLRQKDRQTDSVRNGWIHILRRFGSTVHFDSFNKHNLVANYKTRVYDTVLRYYDMPVTWKKNKRRQEWSSSVKVAPANINIHTLHRFLAFRKNNVYFVVLTKSSRIPQRFHFIEPTV